MTERSGATAPEAPPDAGASVVATAGHVDHGKSSLVTRLTGMDPDRLDEEKRRGLTIELGYAWCTLPSGRELGFVDVPGHERFVRTMLAGVGPVRLVLFVVAADEGWKPQSEEHLEIVDVLGAHGAVIALTKRDLVDAARLERARADVTERVRGTALEGAPIVACSSATGEGFAELVAALDAMLAGAPEPEREGRPRLHVDRVFSIKGSGTVVTGTLTGGPLTTGEEVELLPSGTRARIRGLQTHHRDVESASPVSRVAANLTAERARIARGEVLAPAGQWTATSVLEARIEPVRSLDRPITSRGAFKLHAGAAERDARIRLYDVKQVPADGAFVRITLSEPLVLDVGDRFVLRESGRRRTIAGGVVLDTAPPRRAGPAPTPRLQARAHASRERAPGPPGRRTPGRAGRRRPVDPGSRARGRGRRDPAGRVVGRTGNVRRGRRGDRGSARGVPRRGTRRGRRGRRDGPAIGRGRVRRIGGAARSRARRRRDRSARDRGGARPGRRRGSARVASSRGRRRDRLARGRRSEGRADAADDRRAPRVGDRRRRPGRGAARRVPSSGSHPSSS